MPRPRSGRAAGATGGPAGATPVTSHEFLDAQRPRISAGDRVPSAAHRRGSHGSRQRRTFRPRPGGGSAAAWPSWAKRADAPKAGRGMAQVP